MTRARIQNDLAPIREIESGVLDILGVPCRCPRRLSCPASGTGDASAFHDLINQPVNFSYVSHSSFRSCAPSLVMATAVGFGVAGCKPGRASAERERRRPPATPVMVAPPEERVLTEWKEASGRLDAVESVEIRPRVTGHIDRVAFTSGQLVDKGDVLFVIDPRWHQAALASAEAQLARARVNLANAEREWERNQTLEKTKAISASEADQWRTRVEEGKAARAGGGSGARHRRPRCRDDRSALADFAGGSSRPLLTEGNYVSGVAGFTTPADHRGERRPDVRVCARSMRRPTSITLANCGKKRSA